MEELSCSTLDFLGTKASVVSAGTHDNAAPARISAAGFKRRQGGAEAPKMPGEGRKFFLKTSMVVGTRGWVRRWLKQSGAACGASSLCLGWGTLGCIVQWIFRVCNCRLCLAVSSDAV